MLEGMAGFIHWFNSPRVFKGKEKVVEAIMTIGLNKKSITMLISLGNHEIKRLSGRKNISSFYSEADNCSLIDIRNKLLLMIKDADLNSSCSYAELPESRQYAQRKYRAELDEDLITMIEGLILRQKQQKGGTHIGVRERIKINP